MDPHGHQPAAVSVEFHFEQDAVGQRLVSKVVGGDLTGVASDAGDDWATFALAAAPPADVRALDLRSDHDAAKLSERAFILQHPNGLAKRLAFVRNRITNIEARTLLYVTDTQGGSSGSPVFNAQGKMIAMHCAGGVPQKFAGVPPVKNNQGARIDVIAPAILAR